MSLIRRVVARWLQARAEIPARKWVAVRASELDVAQADQVWQVYSSTYRPVGLAFSTVRALLAEHPVLWCIDADGNGTVDAFLAYKATPFGFKITFIGHDGTVPAQSALAEQVMSMMSRPGWWTESSHKPAALLESRGFKPLDDEAAVRAILRKDIEWLGGGYYTRNISGLGTARKAIYGNPRVHARVATKTPGEREDEETERLSRPPPKLKPPRTDLRRNQVKEPDPDAEKPDKDLSKNYKDVGG